MRHATCLGRLGGLAVGLGIGAALAATPGVASADSSADPFSLIDQLLGGLSVPAETTSSLDMQVDISGFDLFPTADNTATAYAPIGDIAIAIGNGASAYTDGGFFDSAFAFGNDSVADAGGGALSLDASFDTAAVFGDNSTADAGFQGSFDLAAVFGADLGPTTGATGGNFLIDILPSL